jgi:hypothetical protein
MWFVDFRLAERQLGIHTMLSVEVEHAERAEFNRPFGSVQVEHGLSSTVMAKFTVAQWQKPLITWLDYDGALSTDVISDIDLLLSKAASNSVILVTLNASRRTYRSKAPGTPGREHTAVGRIEELLGASSVGAQHQAKQNAVGTWSDVSDQDFPQVFAEAMLTYMQHRTLTKARVEGTVPLRFYPLYSLHHNDGADMITIGGALALEDANSPWNKSLEAHPMIGGPDGPKFKRIDMIPLTMKEKIALDECLPMPEGEAAFLAKAKSSGLKLADAEMIKYRQFYRHFPVFIETPL